jgi:hypothetical protein
LACSKARLENIEANAPTTVAMATGKGGIGHLASPSRRYSMTLSTLRSECNPSLEMDKVELRLE